MLHTTIRVPTYMWREFGSLVKMETGTQRKRNAMINYLIKTYIESEGEYIRSLQTEQEKRKRRLQELKEETRRLEVEILRQKIAEMGPKRA